MFADLHCHPSNRSFNCLRNSSKDPWDNPPAGAWATEQTLWCVNPEDIKKKRLELKKGFTADMAAFPQCDLKSLSDSDTRIVFAALYPIEKGFVMGNKSKGVSCQAFTALVTRLLTKHRLRWLEVVTRPIAVVLNPVAALFVNNRGFGRDFLQCMMMRFSSKRINFLQSSFYDYFAELQKEYEFYSRTSNQDPPPDALPVNRYQLIRDGQHLGTVVNDTPDVGIILTLEGMHMLSQKPAGDTLQYVGDEELARRIALVKTWNIFFVTFSHHYNNELAGHARSLPQLMQEISDQVPGRHKGINDSGWKAIRQLLALNDAGEPDAALGRRVLIDLKHMAARARNEYYTFIQAFNLRHPADPIPAIASHVGYANRTTLRELIEAADGENDDNAFKDRFYQWNINLCDEDVQIIVASGGIIGLSFDQRIVGTSLSDRPASHAAWSFYLANNLFAFARAWIGAGRGDAHAVWDCLALGTDFDGFIDPVNPFGTAERFGYCMMQLLERFTELPAEMKDYLRLNQNPYTPEEVIEKIAWKNAYAFTLKNFKP